MEINFTKYHGAGNDFVVIDNRVEQHFSNEVISYLCHRRFGVGADGILLLSNHVSLDFTMLYINSDGSIGPMCGNGARCLTHFAHQLGIVKKKATFECNGSIFTGEMLDEDLVRVRMLDVVNYKETPFGLWVDAKTPHLVLFKDEIDEKTVRKDSPALRYDPIFGDAGTNVNYCKVGVEHHIDMITYERGVEDITWACGTGAIAGACAYLIQHALEGPQQVSMKSKGGNLDISLRYVPNKGIFDIFMTGPARAVFQGKIDVPT